MKELGKFKVYRNALMDNWRVEAHARLTNVGVSQCSSHNNNEASSWHCSKTIMEAINRTTTENCWRPALRPIQNWPISFQKKKKTKHKNSNKKPEIRLILKFLNIWAARSLQWPKKKAKKLDVGEEKAERDWNNNLIIEHLRQFRASWNIPTVK